MNPVLLDEIIYLAALPLLPALLHLYFKCFFRFRSQSRLRLVMLYLLYMTAQVLLHYSSLPGPILLAGNVGLILGLSLFYQGTLTWRLCTACFISAVIVLNDAAIPMRYTDTGYRLSLLLSKLLMLMLVLLLRRFVKGRHGDS